MAEIPQEEKASRRRPLWLWAVLCLALLAFTALIAFAFYLHNQKPVTPAVVSKIENSNPSPITMGQHLTDSQGKTLYVFDKDTTGKSNCTVDCLKLWPPYLAINPSASLPLHVSVIKRDDGSLQYAWKGLPLYYYAQDLKQGDTKGDGLNGLWHLVKP